MFCFFQLKVKLPAKQKKRNYFNQPFVFINSDTFQFNKSSKYYQHKVIHL